MTITITGRVPCPTIRLWRQEDRPTPAHPWTTSRACVEGIPVVCHHSPDGIEWGYGGSGPADLALSICAYCLPVGCDGLHAARLHQGQCSQAAWSLHQAVKRVLVSLIPHEGMALVGSAIDGVIDVALARWMSREMARAAERVQDGEAS